MKTLTLTQPWATLVAIGAKNIETRSWGTQHRGALAIHAAKSFPKDAQALCAQDPFATALAQAGYGVSVPFPLGHVIAVGNLHHVGRIGESRTGQAFIDGKEWYVKEPELSFGDYTPGRYGWVLSNVWALKVRVPARGALSLWEWEPPTDMDIGMPSWAMAKGR